jgi:hypothetical protein
MRILLFTGFLVVCSANVFCQNYCNCDDKEMAKSFEEKLAGIIIEQSLDNKQFYIPEWRIGTIILINGKKVTDELLKYNGYLNKFVGFETKTGHQVLMNDEEIREIYLMHDGADSAKCFKRMKIKPWYSIDSAYIYLEALAEGITSLYAWRKIDYFPSSNKYEPVFKYFVGLSDGSIHQINPVNRNFLLLAGEQNKSFRTTFRKAQLNIRHENDFIKAIQLYNEFLTGR